MTMASRPRVPDLLLERYALGELPDEEKSRLERELKTDSETRARLDALRRSNAEILAAYPAEAAVARIEQRARLGAAAERPVVRRTWPLFVPLSMALTAGAVAVVVLRPPPAPRSPEQAGLEPTREKGLRPLLLVFAKPQPGRQPAALSDGAAARPHELLQLGYVAAGRAHGVVLSIDGRGAATLHYPAGAGQPTRLDKGQVLLSTAYELDDAPLFERFFFVTAAAPIDVAAVLESARRLASDLERARSGPLSLPAGLEQTSLLLIKKGADP